MTQQMQHNMPAHLKKYIGPYMQQHVVSPGVAPHAPAIHAPRQDFSRVLSGQVPLRPQQVSTQPQQSAELNLPLNPPEAVETNPASAYPPGYDFIINPKKPSRAAWQLPSGSSSATRTAIFCGGLLALFIVFVIAKGLLFGSNSLTPFVAVVQDQQELIHLTTANSQPQNSLSMLDQNLAATVNLSVGSSQLSLVNYLSANSFKVSSGQLSLKVSASLDNQLTAAITAGTYDQTFQQIMQTELATYSNDLRLAYKSAGPKGKALLQNEYSQLVLIDKQLSAASNTGTS
jgi:enamine deaminase RidA (YjgF/YER057c/UK114 family)